MIYITSKKHLFRRCGMAHPKERTGYPDGKFSEEEMEVLKSETMLIVEVVPDDGAIATADKAPDKMTVPELKKLLDKLEVTYPGDAKKDDLIELVKKNTAKPPEE